MFFQPYYRQRTCAKAPHWPDRRAGACFPACRRYLPGAHDRGLLADDATASCPALTASIAGALRQGVVRAPLPVNALRRRPHALAGRASGNTDQGSAPPRSPPRPAARPGRPCPFAAALPESMHRLKASLNGKQGSPIACFTTRICRRVLAGQSNSRAGERL